MSARHYSNRRLLRARDAMDRDYADALDIEAVRITQPAEVMGEPPAAAKTTTA